MLYYLVYASSATGLYSRADLDGILAQSHANNERLGISGALLYKGGNLMQVLEGEQTAVEGLYATISRDPRHSGAIRILEGPQPGRQFPGWSMAFRDLNSPVNPATPGYSEFLNTRLSSSEFAANPSLCQSLLNSFKETM